MNNHLEKSIDERDFLTIDKALQLIWEWRKYRNGVFWNTVYRLGAAIVAVSIVPYLLPDLIGKLGLAVFVFPILGLLLSVFAAWLMAVQYKLYKQADKKFRSLLGKYDTEDIPEDSFINRIFRIAIVKILVVVVLCFGVIVEFFNGLVLLWLIRRGLP